MENLAISEGTCVKAAEQRRVTLLRTMNSPFLRGLGGFLAVLGVVCARDWAAHPAVLQIDTTATVFAVGDVHGDYDRLVKLLAGAGIVTADAGSGGGVRWNAGNSVLVFTGDLINKGPKGPEVIALLRMLREQASRSGGQVVVLMGNHEVDFLRSLGSDKAKEFALQLRAGGLDAASIAACHGSVGEFFCGMPFAARVNDWFFSHAGNTGGRSLARLIGDLEGGVEREGFDTQQLTGDNSLLFARIGSQAPGGRSWYEAVPGRTAEQTLATYASALGVAHLVQGHHHNAVTFPDGKARRPGEMYQWRGLLFLIDAGMSQDIDDSVGAVLRIQKDEASVVCPEGPHFELWSAGKPEASRGVHCGQ
jgi:hypothetical protein